MPQTNSCSTLTLLTGLSLDVGTTCTSDSQFHLQVMWKSMPNSAKDICYASGKLQWCMISDLLLLYIHSQARTGPDMRAEGWSSFLLFALPQTPLFMCLRANVRCRWCTRGPVCWTWCTEPKPWLHSPAPFRIMSLEAISTVLYKKIIIQSFRYVIQNVWVWDSNKWC